MKISFDQFFARVGLAAILILASSCGTHSSKQPEVVATVGKEAITATDLARELEERSKNGEMTNSPAQRETVLQDMIRLEVLYQKAKLAGFDRDPQLEKQFKRMVAAKFEEVELKQAPPVARPERGEIETYYQAHRDRFTTPEKVHVAILCIRIPTKAGAEQQAKAQATAESLREKALADAAANPAFGMLAQENSDDQATRYRGGDCGWITRENPKYDWAAQVLNGLFALNNPGEITPVIRTQDGFYIGKLIEKKAAVTAPLEAVQERIERQLMAAKQKQARAQFEQNQRQGLAVDINHALLQTLEVPKVSVSKLDVPAAMPAP